MIRVADEAKRPRAEQIQADSEKRMQWTREADRAIVRNVPEAPGSDS